MRARRTFLLLALAATFAACGRRSGTEDVQLRVEGSHLVIENRSGADVHVQLLEDPMLMAWIPASLPGNLLPDGQSRRHRVAPSERGKRIQLAWWRPGDKIDDSGIRGPDRMRRIRLTLPPLAEPLSDDERLIEICLAIGREGAAEFRERPRGLPETRVSTPPPPVSEASCVALAESQCASGQCGLVLQERQQQLAVVRDALARHRAANAATVLGSQPGSPAGAMLVDMAKAAFGDLAAGRIESYVARLCPGLREGYAGEFMRGALRKTGEDFRRRGILLGKGTLEGKGRVTIDAADEAMMTGRKPALPMLAIQASFDITAEGRPCLNLLEERR
jgi:hypothetical protein